jgi:hypothetical protein
MALAINTAGSQSSRRRDPLAALERSPIRGAAIRKLDGDTARPKGAIAPEYRLDARHKIPPGPNIPPGLACLHRPVIE